MCPATAAPSSVRVLASSMLIPADAFPDVLNRLPDTYAHPANASPVQVMDSWLRSFGFHTLVHRDGLRIQPTPADQPGLAVPVAPGQPVQGSYREAMVRLAGYVEGELILAVTTAATLGEPGAPLIIADHSRCNYTQPAALTRVYREYPPLPSRLQAFVPEIKRDWTCVTYWGLHGGVQVQPAGRPAGSENPFTEVGMQVTHKQGVPDNPDWKGTALLTAAGLTPTYQQDTIAGDETVHLDGYTCDECGHVGWVPAGDWPTIVPGCTCTSPAPILYGINQVAVSYNPNMHTSTDVADMAVAFTRWVNGQAVGWRITPIGLPGRAKPTVITDYSWEPIETLFAQAQLRPEPAIA